MHIFKWMKALHKFRLTTYLTVSNYKYLYLMLLTDNFVLFDNFRFSVSKAFLCCSTRLPVSVHKCKFYGQMFNIDTPNYCHSDGCCAYFWKFLLSHTTVYTQTPAICTYHQVTIFLRTPSHRENPHSIAITSTFIL